MKEVNGCFVGDKEKYFSLALEWYFTRYVVVVTERAWLTVCLSVLTTFMLVLALDIYSMFPTKTAFSFVKYTDIYSDEFSRIKRLSSDVDEKEEDILSSYLAGEYVKRYESYSRGDEELRLGFVKNNSSRKIFVGFKNMIERGAAIHALISKYNTEDITLSAVIDKVELLPKNIASMSSAIVEFKVKYLVHGVLAETQSRKVQLSFSLSSVRMAAAGVVPFEFTIHAYQYID
ncbi:VirB8/TrbF family protein [Candidatus Anaplasma sp. TIGMIC]|uniref:VirB8/TrbF family protein n=1 Tax=Candidatus Anaplasma sp. TIGMIC TaxID=3020713 RepID=UPI00232ED227|nr:VirB8/TrbF family protein [Candidatus Anaplasma sp. TIGMIC]MDB1135148.1 VirB8/TrbF family protein [Candidatus Anaplasma sp. TIGMIC]